MNQRHGFTLIEILIVIAIIAIGSASLMGAILLPMRDHFMASQQAAWQSGATAFFHRLVEDVRTADGMEIDEKGAVTFLHGERTRVYTVDPRGILRMEPGGVALLTDVESLTVGRDGEGVLHVDLLGGVEVQQSSLILRRELTLNAPKWWSTP